MAQVRANQMQFDQVYVMRTFRRKTGSNYQYDLVRFIGRTSESKLNELKSDDAYYVIIGDVPVKLSPSNGVLTRSLDGRNFRVTFQTEDTAVALGLTGTPITFKEASEMISDEIPKLAEMPPLEEQMKRSRELRKERAENAKALREQKESIVDDSVIPVEPVEPVLPPEPVEPVEPAQKAVKVRKPLTAEQKARKNEMARARRAAQKAV